MMPSVGAAPPLLRPAVPGITTRTKSVAPRSAETVSTSIVASAGAKVRR